MSTPREDVPATRPMLPIAEQLLLGRYQVKKIIGRGAMGEVLEVFDIHSDTAFAIKRIPPEVSRDQASLVQIRRNFALANQLTHPHIANVRFLEVDSTTNQYYVIMDLVRGKNLAEWMIEKRNELDDPQAPLPLDLVIGITEQIAAGLDYAHSQPISRGSDGKTKAYGILHRDLKPANIMIEEDREYRPGIPFVKIVDFGLAAEIQANLLSQSMPDVQNEVTGTPFFMAPEQFQGRVLTRGMDQWALAVMIFEMVAGRLPFPGPTIAMVQSQAMAGDPAPPESLSPNQWAALKTTFQIDRRLRHSSCVALVKAIADASAGKSHKVMAPELSLPDEMAGIRPSGEMVSPIVRDRPNQNKRVRIIAASAAAALIALVIYFVATRQGTIPNGQIASNENARKNPVATADQIEAEEKLKVVKDAESKVDRFWSDYESTDLPGESTDSSLLDQELEKLAETQNFINEAIVKLGKFPESVSKLAKLRDRTQFLLFERKFKRALQNSDKEEAKRLLNELEFSGAAEHKPVVPLARLVMSFQQFHRANPLDPKRAETAPPQQEVDSLKALQSSLENEYRNRSNNLPVLGKRFNQLTQEAINNDLPALMAWHRFWTEFNNYKASADSEKLTKAESLKNSYPEMKILAETLKYDAAMRVGRALLSAKQWNKAKESFESAKQILPNDLDAIMGIATAIEGAATERESKADRKQIDSLYLEAVKNFQDTNYSAIDKILATIDEILKIDPKEERALSLKKVIGSYIGSMAEGNLALKEGQWDDAEKAFSRANEHRKDDEGAKKGIINAQAAKRDAHFEEAIAAIKDLLSTEPENEGRFLKLSESKRDQINFHVRRAELLKANEPILQEYKTKLSWPLCNANDEVADFTRKYGLERECRIELKKNGFRFEMVLVLPGKFKMGTEEPGAPAQDVQISTPFYLGKYPITVEQFEYFINDSHYVTEAEKDTSAQRTTWTNPGFKQEKSHPVVFVSWNDANAFCSWLSEKSGIVVQLPMEAQWEYSARGPNNLKFPWGNEWDGTKANHSDQSLKKSGMANGEFFMDFSNVDDGFPCTSPVGHFSNASWCGAFDMAGNVWQLCDPLGPSGNDGQKVMRGGSWKVMNVDRCRSTTRAAIFQNQSKENIGFRIMTKSIALKSNELISMLPINETIKPAQNTEKNNPPLTNVPKQTYVPWDGKESVTDYARRHGLQTTRTLTLGGGVNLELVLVPAGRFTMGSPESESDRKSDEIQHQVTISRPFYLGKNEVTQKQFRQVMNSNPSDTRGEDNPVEKITWNGAGEFCEKVSKSTGTTVLLPTEAQWEFACRAGTTTRYYTGENEDNLKTAGWYWNAGKGRITIPVGSRDANAFGLYDTHGNVWEWCRDWYGDYSEKNETDPIGPQNGKKKVIRGGSWYSKASFCRSATRDDHSPDNSDNSIGFRIMMEVGPAGQKVGEKAELSLRHEFEMAKAVVEKQKKSPQPIVEVEGNGAVEYSAEKKGGDDNGWIVDVRHFRLDDKGKRAGEIPGFLKILVDQYGNASVLESGK